MAYLWKWSAFSTKQRRLAHMHTLRTMSKRLKFRSWFLFSITYVRYFHPNSQNASSISTLLCPCVFFCKDPKLVSAFSLFSDSVRNGTGERWLRRLVGSRFLGGTSSWGQHHNIGYHVPLTQDLYRLGSKRNAQRNPIGQFSITQHTHSLFLLGTRTPAAAPHLCCIYTI